MTRRAGDCDAGCLGTGPARPQRGRMRVPDSGMPEQTYWESLFDVPGILDRLEIGRACGDVVELGCGYGTFTVPVAQRIAGTLLALDIDPLMVAQTHRRALAAGLANVRAEQRDVLAAGFGTRSEAVAACLLFNILHFPEPEALLREARRVIRPDGRVLVVHWRSDVPTPRGPPLEIRPRPEQVAGWAEAAGLQSGPALELPPWHFGVALTRR